MEPTGRAIIAKNRPTPRHIIWKFQRTSKRRAKLLKRKIITFKGLEIRISLNFPASTSEARKAPKHGPLSVKCEGRIKMFSGKQFSENLLPVHSFSGSY